MYQMGRRLYLRRRVRHDGIDHLQLLPGDDAAPRDPAESARRDRQSCRNRPPTHHRGPAKFAVYICYRERNPPVVCDLADGLTACHVAGRGLQRLPPPEGRSDHGEHSALHE